MITAKNYAAQCEANLRKYSATYGDDAYVANEMADTLKKSVHFVLPDAGKLFDDQRKGIQGHDVRLPFDKISIEFCFKENGNNYKVVILAEEINANDFFSNPDFSIGIVIRTCLFSNGIWFPSIGSWVMPSNWDSSKGRNILNPDEVFIKKISVAGFPLPNMPARYKINLENDENGLFAESLFKDSASDCKYVLELIEALSCKNVEQSIHQAASPKNAQRIKSHKLPIYETKVLTIKASSTTLYGAASQGGSHASPRQHLRRGHIRRLESGNIWVNSCIVGDSEKGVIKKQYQVTN